MPADRFTNAELVYTFEPEVGKHRRLIGGWTEDHRRTVNSYLAWLRQMGVGYEVRINSQNVYLVKSHGLH